MGIYQSKSLSTTDILELVTNVVSNTVIKKTTSCSSSNLNTQSLQIINSTGDVIIEDIDFNINSIINFECLQVIKTDSEILNSIKSEIVQQVKNEIEEAVVPPALISQTSSSVVNFQKNITNMTSSIEIEDVMNCMSNIENDQNITFIGHTGNIRIKAIKLSVVNNIISKCLLNNSTTVKSINELSQSIEKVSENSYQAIVAGIVGCISSLCCCILLIIILVKVLNKNDK
jgi:hypothetical protein